MLIAFRGVAAIIPFAAMSILVVCIQIDAEADDVEWDSSATFAAHLVGVEVSIVMGPALGFVSFVPCAAFTLTVGSVEIFIVAVACVSVHGEVHGVGRGGIGRSLAGAALGVSLKVFVVEESTPALVSDVPVAAITGGVTDGSVNTISAEVITTPARATHILCVEFAVVVKSTVSLVGVPVPATAITRRITEEVVI